MPDNINHPYLKVWTNIRKGRERILIYHEEESYLVVLEKSKSYIYRENEMTHHIILWKLKDELSDSQKACLPAM